MYNVMRFWLDRGVDGLRIDVLWMPIKDAQFRDNPINPDWKEGDLPWAHQVRLYSEDQPEVHEIVSEMRAVMDTYAERVLIGETYLPLPSLMRYYGETLNGAHLPFNFQLTLLEAWNAQVLREAVETYEAALPAGAWPNWVLGNHDKPRIASHLGRMAARVATMLLLTLRGTPTWYYGDEIGMQDVPIPPHLAHDPQGKRQPGYGRDPMRTPMQWGPGPHADFSTVEPWLPLSADRAEVNVSVERSDPKSILSLHRPLRGLDADEPERLRRERQRVASHHAQAGPRRRLAVQRHDVNQQGRRRQTIVAVGKGPVGRRIGRDDIGNELAESVEHGPLSVE